jgi:hypothetical protein
VIQRVLNIIKRSSQETPIMSDDAYVSWLSFANAGMLNPGNVYCFDYAIKHLPTKNPVVEIGSFCGLSTNVISYFLQKHNKQNTIFTADKWIFEGAENGGVVGDSIISHAEYKSFIIDSYKRNVSFFSRDNLPYTIELFSDEFFEKWREGMTLTDVFGRSIKLGGGISFAYVDGNHSYEFVKRDFQNIASHLDTGGFILFDDSSDGSPFESTKFMKEVGGNSDFKLVMKNPNYLFQKIKH